MTDLPLQLIGKTLGPYHIISCIGRGAMASVYRARHMEMGNHVAVKVLHGRLSRDAEAVQRFFNEARAANMIKHQSIVEVYDCGTADGIGAYLLLEHLDGEPLDMRLQRQPMMPAALAAKLIHRVASGLAAAHAVGIVHRDLKPSNIFLLPDADRPGELRVKILDFGSAKLTPGAAGGVVTHRDSVMGTPNYMSPEHCRGAAFVEHRSDIYALGVIGFEMVCGRPPFVGEGYAQVIAMHLNKPPPPLRSFAPDTPPALEQALLRALAKDPAQRWGWAVELGEAVLAAVGLARPPVRSGATQPWIPDRSSATPGEDPERTRPPTPEQPAPLRPSSQARATSPASYGPTIFLSPRTPPAPAAEQPAAAEPRGYPDTLRTSPRSFPRTVRQSPPEDEED